MAPTDLAARPRLLGPGEILALAAIAAAFVIPALSSSPLVYSIANQSLIAITGAFGVYVMMRMNLLTFAVPAFMAAGGYAAAIAGKRYGVTDVVALAAFAFAVPAFLAMPLGALVLRLRGVYFVLVTFVLTEITQLVLFETPGLTGGSNGIVGMPVVTFFGIQLADNAGVLHVTAGLALAAAVLTALLTGLFRDHFASIEENEVLAESLGLVVWRYKALGFVVSAGIAGLAGFATVNMLLTAHPTSFAPLSSVNYIAYAIVGGKSSMIGSVVGGTALIWAQDLFAIRGEYSQGLFGILIMVVVLAAREGIVGILLRLWRAVTPAPAPAAATVPVEEKAR